MNPLDPKQNWMVQAASSPSAREMAPAEQPRDAVGPQESFRETSPQSGDAFEVGERHEQELEQRYGTGDDPGAAARLERLAELLLPLATRSDVEYIFRALATDLAFASACPNGTVFFTRGLLVVFPEDPPLLFFGAHELTHTERGHYASRRRRFEELTRRGGWSRSPEERTALELAAVVEVRHQEEYEADQGAVEMLARLGYGAEVGVDALQRLWDACRRLSPEALASSPLSPGSHPSFADRIKRLKSPQQPAPPAGRALRNLRRYLG